MAIRPKKSTSFDKKLADVDLKRLDTIGIASRILTSLDICDVKPNAHSDYLRHHVLSKYVVGVDDHERLKGVAIAKLQESERHCAMLNTERPWVRSGLLDSVRQIISDVLGPFRYSDVLHYARFSGGASTLVSRKSSTPCDKFALRCPEVTPLCLKYALALFENTNWGDTIDRPLLIRGNRVVTVPKNDKTDRAIAIEPTLNMWFQLGVGGYIRRRLKSVAFIAEHGPLTVDLNNQMINREFARQGSLYKNLATIDLSSASDNISWRLVYDLLPADWFKYLDDIRSHCSKDGTYNWEKFSAMGNGFTFELESLIFYAVVKAAQLHRGTSYFSSVYGDDIVCPDDSCEEVMSSLRAFGFKVNVEKTFHGPSAIRESCGGHYFNGNDITPFFIRKPLTNLDAYCKLLNELRSFGSVPLNGILVSDPRLYDVWLELYRALGQNAKLLRHNSSDELSTGILVPYAVRRTYRLVNTIKTDIPLPEIGRYLERLSGVSQEQLYVNTPLSLSRFSVDILRRYSSVVTAVTDNTYRVIVSQTCLLRRCKDKPFAVDLSSIPIFPQELLYT